MITQHEPPMPTQRNAEHSCIKGDGTLIAHAASLLIRGEIIMIENGPVFALAGDANNPQMQAMVGLIKKDRSPTQPLGWITPFNNALQAFDLSDVKDRALKNFLVDPDAMTTTLGALAFIRAKANQRYKKQHGVPDALIPPQIDVTEPTMVQLFSPTTNDRCSRLVRYATAHGVRVSMTSANYHNRKEIVDFNEAQEFAKQEGNMFFLPQYDASSKPARPMGSYPVFKVLPDKLKLIRFGFLEPTLWNSILKDLPLDLSPGLTKQEPNYPANVLRAQDLPEEDRTKTGREMHDAIIQTIMRTKSATVQY
ncbi:hypothetical protein H7Y63_00890 [Polaromonas sp.]|nr:hypothetical protein [Candidatus Saccharibacteria bacterium]